MNLSIDITVPKPDTDILESLRQKVNSKTKPIGALGLLEDIAIQIGQIQGSLSPELSSPHVLVFAADHGITKEGVSKYPSEVTQQMVHNFLGEGAAINVFTKQHGITLKIIDAGVNHLFDYDGIRLINQKIGYGTRNFFNEPAMTKEEVDASLKAGFDVIDAIVMNKCNVVGFGEMGIGNTSSASIIVSKLLNLPIQRCVGRGTGLDDNELKRKFIILKEAIEKNKISNDPLDVLQTFGGFEIAQMAGAMIRAAQCKMTILVDGFIASAAFLVAYRLAPNVLNFCIFCHQSKESGHEVFLDQFDVKPILDMEMRLGEGTGCALAYPIIASAVNFLNEMASFESAGVSKDNREAVSTTHLT